jgi:hypothetical protein
MIEPRELLAIHREGTALVEAFLGRDGDTRARMTAALRPRDGDHVSVLCPEVSGRGAAACGAFWMDPVGETGAATQARVVMALGGDAGPASGGFDRKLNVTNHPVTTPPRVYQGPDGEPIPRARPQDREKWTDRE